MMPTEPTGSSTCVALRDATDCHIPAETVTATVEGGFTTVELWCILAGSLGVLAALLFMFYVVMVELIEGLPDDARWARRCLGVFLAVAVVATTTVGVMPSFVDISKPIEVSYTTEEDMRDALKRHFEIDGLDVSVDPAPLAGVWRANWLDEEVKYRREFIEDGRLSIGTGDNELTCDLAVEANALHVHDCVNLNGRASYPERDAAQ